MLDYLEHYRSNNCSYFSDAAYKLADMGFDMGLKEADARFLNEGRKQAYHERRVMDLLEANMASKTFGLIKAVDKRERDLITSVLMLNTPEIGLGGVALSKYHAYMHQMGFGIEIKASDLRFIQAERQRLMGIGDGVALASMLAYMSKAKVPLKIGEDELALIRKGLEDSRKNGLEQNLIAVHYALHELLPPLSVPPTPPIPPLKRFRV